MGLVVHKQDHEDLKFNNLDKLMENLVEGGGAHWVLGLPFCESVTIVDRN